MTTTTTPPIVSAGDLSPHQLTARERRALQPLMIATWSIEALWPRLPLLFPTDPNVPPSPKTRYRSQYRYPGAEALQDPAKLAAMSPFEVSLHLIDFSPLEPLLALHYKQSHKGEVPFHPVSMFLALLLRRQLNLSWRGLATLLAGEHGAEWRALCGFQAQDPPSASGLRYFSLQVSPDFFDQLCERFVDLLLRESLCSAHSTYPGDPPDQGVTITQDGMLHPARHGPACPLATDACYQPLPKQGACATPPRPCRARDLGHEGCACDTPACQERCCQASTLDPEARFIRYDGRNKPRKPDTGEEQAKQSGGTNVFGYRSIADRILDDQFHVAWTARSVLHPANTDERTVFVQGFTHLRQRFPSLRIGEWIDDAAIGYAECLQAIWAAGALRMVDTRADAGDRDPQTCLVRGYDAQGHPLCPHGYPLHSNGYDRQRRRRKWLCRQTCRRQPRREGEAVQPVADCPYLDPQKGPTLGYVVNVGLSFPDGSLRLARDIPYGSPLWKARYGRRSNAESRNAQLEGMGLKRMRSYGLPRNTKEVQMADLIVNLRTMGRLVQEASRLHPADPDG
jgi:hypothetical protein